MSPSIVIFSTSIVYIIQTYLKSSKHTNLTHVLLMALASNFLAAIGTFTPVTSKSKQPYQDRPTHIYNDFIMIGPCLR